MNVDKKLLDAVESSQLTSTQNAPLIAPRENAIKTIFDHFFTFAQQNRMDLGITLAALFDLLVGLDYIELIFQPQQPKKSESSSALSANISTHSCQGEFYIPFVNSCPGCLIKHKKIVKAEGFKPQSAHIGEASSQILSHLFALLLQARGQHPNAQVCVARKNTEEIDVVFVFPHQKIVFLSEVKASPLVTYPALLKLHSTALPGQDHKRTSVPIQNIQSVDLLLQSGHLLSIWTSSKRTNNFTLGWAFNSLAQSINPAWLTTYLKSWKELYDILRRRLKPSETPKEFFLTHGCGQRDGVNVSDSKNMPGFDRTDDIKKAVYQTAAMSAKYLIDSYANSYADKILVGIISNIGPTRHFNDYLKDILEVALFVPKKVHTSGPHYIVPRAYWRYLFDAIIAFDYRFFNNVPLKQVVDPLFQL
ncbi:MAG: hypothetical protein QW196_06325 [Sulfolobales archaeon]